MNPNETQGNGTVGETQRSEAQEKEATAKTTSTSGGEQAVKRAPQVASSSSSEAESNPTSSTGERSVSADSPTRTEIAFKPNGAEKLGIVGGKGVGKSYLFQAMVYRTCANKQAASLAYYLDQGSIELSSALIRGGQVKNENLPRFIKNYESWNRLPQTILETQRWYWLRLPYRNGLLGFGRSFLEVEFFDASGEGFLQREEGVRQDQETWESAYLQARVMVFCLPIWAAFPDANLSSQEDRQESRKILENFENVVANFTALRRVLGATYPVLSILALTMADDRRSALKALRERWITPYLRDWQNFLRRLHTGRGVSRYLANARKVSEALHREFEFAHPLVARLPNQLESFGGGKPWLIPLSAINGSQLEYLENNYPNPDQRVAQNPPVPVHVELPLLVALCERANALM